MKMISKAALLAVSGMFSMGANAADSMVGTDVLSLAAGLVNANYESSLNENAAWTAGFATGNLGLADVSVFSGHYKGYLNNIEAGDGKVYWKAGASYYNISGEIAGQTFSGGMILPSAAAGYQMDFTPQLTGGAELGYQGIASGFGVWVGYKL